MEPRADAGDHEADGGREDGYAGEDEVAADAAQRGRTPGEERADSGEEDEEEADGDHHLVVVRANDGDLGAGEELGEHGQQGAVEDGEACGEEDEVVE
jgi:hypothetical protein